MTTTRVDLTGLDGGRVGLSSDQLADSAHADRGSPAAEGDEGWD